MGQKIAVVGTGYVGLSMATLLAQHNHVTAVDILPEKYVRRAPEHDNRHRGIQLYQKRLHRGPAAPDGRLLRV